MTGQTKISEIFYDIRKLYQFRAPRIELADYIEFFSETSLEATQQFISTEKFTVTLFPSFTPTIWINLGSPYELSNGGTVKRIGKNNNVLVLRSTLLERNNLSTDNIFTVKFHPLGFESIFGISQASIGHNVISPADILPSFVLKKMKDLISLGDKSIFLENFFLAQLHRNKADRYHLQCIKRSIEIFASGNMGMKLGAIASQLNTSEKTFNRYFHQVIGTNPKSFFSTMRCRQAITQYKKDPQLFSPFDFGYYDFSHFSKEVKQFTGANLTSAARG